MISPTVGRVVWYHPGPEDPWGSKSDEVQAAIIAAVFSDTEVNLMVITPNGEPYQRQHVTLHQEGNEAPANGYAEWMPYQKQVASGQIPPTLHAKTTSRKTTKNEGK